MLSQGFWTVNYKIIYCLLLPVVSFILSMHDEQKTRAFSGSYSCQRFFHCTCHYRQAHAVLAYVRQHVEIDPSLERRDFRLAAAAHQRVQTRSANAVHGSPLDALDLRRFLLGFSIATYHTPAEIGTRTHYSIPSPCRSPVFVVPLQKLMTLSRYLVPFSYSGS